MLNTCRGVEHGQTITCWPANQVFPLNELKILIVQLITVFLHEEVQRQCISWAVT